ncbi:transporter substrate-binding domain-containing protein [Paracoccus sp. (in: a-proteobacteria)]|uniref:transporter substrate-binding domain-containing protein n=1 Tax=Paracoccus sp. TaxID=267 RepID=UPI0026DF54E9|nr:transporter substrate-binding domain-containing protein [Paracoccus sp. (in: a-proteobacteria)]MDO5648675.1 transporter substrate-binding domain-containing protein [Paracoccus sp. (in: a-proteobacteria)]
MKKLTLAACALALTAGLGHAQTVRIGTEGAYPPYNFINDATGEVDGFEIELGNELCKRAELDCVWVRNDWDSIIPNLVSGNYDAIMAGMSMTEERKQVIQFSDGYTHPAPSAYVALSADVDVEGGVVAAQINTIQAAYVAETGATLLEFANLDQSVAAVRNGEADALFVDKEPIIPYVNESNGQLVFVDGKDEVAVGDGMGIGLRQSDTELRDKFNAALASMKADGSLNALLTKWVENAQLFD